MTVVINGKTEREFAEWVAYYEAKRAAAEGPSVNRQTNVVAERCSPTTRASGGAACRERKHRKAINGR